MLEKNITLRRGGKVGVSQKKKIQQDKLSEKS